MFLKIFLNGFLEILKILTKKFFLVIETKNMVFHKKKPRLMARFSKKKLSLKRKNLFRMNLQESRRNSEEFEDPIAERTLLKSKPNALKECHRWPWIKKNPK